MFDLGILAQPVAADPPCGSDLDLEGDVQYLNYFAGVESKFPKSYFEVKDANGELKRFDSKSIDAEQLFETAKPLFSRTRDLRLLILLAKVSILARDLASFVRLVEAVALLLETEWENVHPKGEGGDFSYRGVMIESIDALPTVINPLQFLPLVENRRHGTISYRVIQIVSGEIAVGENEVVPDLTAIDRIIEEADLAPLKATSASFVQLATAIDRIGPVVERG
jgi:type VI secretion system protein ImpA